MKTQLKRALVTGAAGFIGARLSDYLVARGWTVAKLLRRQPSPLFSHVDGERHPVWIEGEAPLAARLEAFAPDVVFNLAGNSQIAQAQRDPSFAFDANTASVWRLLHALQELPQKPVVVHASSVALYGNLSGPLVESDVVSPKGIYAASKAAAEIIASSFDDSIPIVVARLGNVYGPGDKNAGRLIPYLMDRLSAGLPVVLREGASQRSYVHLDDVIVALCALAERGADAGVRGEAFNVAGDRLYSNRAVATLARDVSGRHDLVIAVESEAATPAVPISIAKITDRCGWTPRIALREGLRGLFNERVALCA